MPLIEPWSNDAERQIIDNLVNGLRNLLTVGQDQIYPAIAPAYVAGQNDRVIQISPGSTSTFGDGQGAQEGGAMINQMQVRLTFWYRLKVDQHQRTDVLLTEEYYGMLAWCNRVRNLLRLTTLGGVLYMPMQFVSLSEAAWYDEDGGVVRRDMLWNTNFAENLPNELTMTDDDVRPLVTT